MTIKVEVKVTIGNETMVDGYTLSGAVAKNAIASLAAEHDRLRARTYAAWCVAMLKMRARVDAATSETPDIAVVRMAGTTAPVVSDAEVRPPEPADDEGGES